MEGGRREFKPPVLSFPELSLLLGVYVSGLGDWGSAHQIEAVLVL